MGRSKSFASSRTLYYSRPPKKYDSSLQREACKDLRTLYLTPHLLLDENLVLLLEKRRSIEGLYTPDGDQQRAASHNEPFQTEECPSEATARRLR